MAGLDSEMERRFDKSTSELRAEADQFKTRARSDPAVVATYLPRLRKLLEAAGYSRDEMMVRDDVQRTILAIADQQPEALSDEYPDLVAAFLDTRETRVLTQRLLHNCAELWAYGVTRQEITDGLDVVEGEIVDQLADIAEQFDDDGRVPGNGATAMALSQRVADFAHSVAGRQQLVVEAASDALFDLVRFHASEKGIDPIDGAVDLRSRYETDSEPFVRGFSDRGTIESMRETEETQTKNYVLRYVVDALVATSLIVSVERDEARMLRIEAVLAERDQ
ncbi:TCP-1/cpn60 chaperonin family protein [Halomicrobium mukohataei]|uniref:Uncharacterized protein n=2 Tax=Halomicrobium mukohataei TaxID=57705 RepID=C7P4Z4_HALMD|nr:TCP-1/cpn60 chaperonin family protein [Halomicrobium mukohataei]ACV49389.1 hypothetical protein Hmuk_3292 [Halomicrobium mukohataei DSM 12286]QCD67217.1 hypothetical protein E5139_16340 [Halomicrobium mukohataei]